MDVCGYSDDSLVCYCDALQPKTDYSLYEDRLKSFENWPIQMKQTAEMLAHAGLYYKKTGDLCACFKCDIRLKDWTSYDDPWTEHQKYSPKCEYLLMVGKPHDKNNFGIWI